MTDKNLPAKRREPIKAVTSRVPQIRSPRPKGTVSIAYVLGHPGKPKTHRQHRIARKQFKRCKNVPNGYRLEYVMQLSTDTNPVLPDIVKNQWKELDEASIKMFNKKYFSLSSKEQSKVHESFHQDGKAARA
jgi:hypothetical protein